VEGASVTFPGGSVSSGGHVLVTEITQVAVPLPPTFSLATEFAFDVDTDVIFSGPVEVCLPYPDADSNGFVDGTVPPLDETLLSLFHLEGGVWVDITLMGGIDPVSNQVCGDTTFFSEFGVLGLAAPVVPALTPISQMLLVAVLSWCGASLHAHRRRETRVSAQE
jgi:hypothetical protein